MKPNPELIFSTRESRSIPHMVSEGEIVVVCGVWQKGTILRYAQAVGPSGHVVFVEANPDNVERLSALTKDMAHVTWINRGVWSEKAELSFTRSTGGRHSWDKVKEVQGRFPYSKVEGHEDITIQADTIDNILAELGISHIDHLNLTVNRCEFRALEGARGTIANNTAMRLRLPSREREITCMVSLLEDMGFTVYKSLIPAAWLSKPTGKRYRVYAVKGEQKNG